MVKLKERAERIKYPALCQIAIPSHPLPISIFIRDLSFTGLGIEASKPLAKNEIINLSIFLPFTRQFLTSKAQVVRCEKGLATYIVGLKFIGMKLKQRFRLWKEMRWLRRNIEHLVSSYSHIMTPEMERLMKLMETEIEAVYKVKEGEGYHPRAKRVKYPIIVRIGLTNVPFPISGFLQDISLTGLGLKSKWSLPVNEVVNLSFFLPVSRSFVNVKGIVVRCEKIDTDWICGLKFADLDGETKFSIWREVEKMEL